MEKHLAELEDLINDTAIIQSRIEALDKEQAQLGKDLDQLSKRRDDLCLLVQRSQH